MQNQVGLRLGFSLGYDVYGSFCVSVGKDIFFFVVKERCWGFVLSGFDLKFPKYDFDD